MGATSGEAEVLHPESHQPADSEQESTHSSHTSTASRKVRKSKIARWGAHALIILGLLLGTIFSIVHHFYYDHFNGKVVGKQWQQTWIIRGGSAFGFAVKTSLAVAAGTAYTQQFWLSLRSKGAPVSKVNSMFGVLNNALDLMDVKLWLGRPVLFVPAVITWLVPLVAIVTPGTLVVEPTLQPSILEMAVPRINFANVEPYTSVAYDGSYNGVTGVVANIAAQAAGQGSILTITPPVVNSSYTISFYGPALKCDQASSSEVATLTAATGMYDPGSYQVYYLSWVPSTPNALNVSHPKFPTASANSEESDPQDEPLDFISDDFARLFVYTEYSNSAFTCGLRNMTYTVTFDFETEKQNIIIHTSNDVGGVAAPDGGNRENPYNFPYFALMEALGRIMVGEIDEYSGQETGVEPPLLTTIENTVLDGVRQGTNATAFGVAIEELFQNITVSLLSNSNFHQPTNLSSTPQTSVHTLATRNTYIYHPFDLYLAYGLAIFATSICLLIGVVALASNGAAHTNLFSTIVRTTRSHDFDRLVSGAEAVGTDPLPETLASAIVYLPRRGQYTRGFEVVHVNSSSGT